MPSFMVRGQRQMTTEDANCSRLVTKIRWVVESANGRIKQWKYLDHVLPTCQTPSIGDLVKIVCAVCNRYLKPLSTGDVTEDQALGSKMLYLSKQTNALQQYVEDNNLDRRTACWLPVDDVEDFPMLDEDQLRSITCGSYQLKLSQSYAVTRGRLYCTHSSGGNRASPCSTTEQTHFIKVIFALDKI